MPNVIRHREGIFVYSGVYCTAKVGSDMRRVFESVSTAA